MIDGITILSESVYRGCDSKLCFGFAMASLIFAILAIGCLITDEYGELSKIFLTFVCLCVTAAVISYLVWRQTMYEFPEYKVTISDDVSFNELYEKYEIVEQEGEIYTIRERRKAGDGE